MIYALLFMILSLAGGIATITVEKQYEGRDTLGRFIKQIKRTRSIREVWITDNGLQVEYRTS